MIMDNEQPHQELVKCVVVGDTAVGKTRLICARACNKQVSLSQLITTHIPTVWAIDQYRIYKEVLERSWEVVDGVSVSLRLWDTFGDHDKDRRFAYGRSDVVLLCFSITNPISLRNCKVMWYPEIRRFCPTTPIVLVGCKNDLRYMYMDEQFMSYCKDRSPFVRPIRECDILTPDQGRAVAKEIGAPYYETSVLTYYGVNEVFENVIRAALIERRRQRFWMTNLKKVQRPLIQVPFCPPKPPTPELSIPVSQFEEDLHVLWETQAHCDVIFRAGNVGIPAHKIILVAICPAFHKLFMMDLSTELCTRSSSDSSMDTATATPCPAKEKTDVGPRGPGGPGNLISPRPMDCWKRAWSSDSSLVSSLGDAALGNFNADTECLLSTDSESSRSLDTIGCHKSVHSNPLYRAALHAMDTPAMNRTLDHPAFTSICMQQVENVDPKGKPGYSVQTVVSLVDKITPLAMQHVLAFIYTGMLDIPTTCSLEEILVAAKLMDVPGLPGYVANMINREDYLNSEIQARHVDRLREKIVDVGLLPGLLTDILFQVEDGNCAAHRPILMARSEMMSAMFSGDFREGSAKVVEFPGVKRDCFGKLLMYLYTDSVPPVKPADCVGLLELGNRLCLHRLVALVEQNVINYLSQIEENGGDISEETLHLLEPCQMHNADQLADWCMMHIATNYNTICKQSPKLLRNLHPENQAYLNRHRWPPVWYLKEFDYYERCVQEREREEKPLKVFKRPRNNSGCLCFSSKSRRNADTHNYCTM